MEIIVNQLLQRYESWWNHRIKGRPLMRVVAQEATPKPLDKSVTPEVWQSDPRWILKRWGNSNSKMLYYGDAFPSFRCDLGPGSLALYLGGEPEFAWDTVWFRPIIEDIENLPSFHFDETNRWWKRHLEIIDYINTHGEKGCLIELPDLVEGLDIYAAMRGTQNALFDLMDYPDTVKESVDKIDASYLPYYDLLRKQVQTPDGIMAYAAFHIMGMGRIAKIQCDFSAMISTEQYRSFALPCLRKQTERMNHTVYHLDGPDAIRHVPAIMELEELDALQWTCGAGKPDGGCPRWYPIYDQVVKAGKSLWISLHDGAVEDQIQRGDELLNRYGSMGMYFIFPIMHPKDADQLMNYAEKRWNSV